MGCPRSFTLMGVSDMSNAQSGWFPDPANAGQLRWWDGEAWSNDVVRDGVTLTEPLVAPGDAASTASLLSRVPWWGWAISALLGIVLLIIAAPLLALASLAILITGIVALSSGKRTWLALPSKKVAGLVTAAAAVTFMLSGGITSVTQAGGGGQSDVALIDSAANATTATPTPTPTRSRVTASPTPTPVIEVVREIVTEAIPFERQASDDGNLQRGTVEVRVAGVDGELSRTYDVTMRDGVEVERTLIVEQITRQPTHELTVTGTYDPPAVAPEPAAESGCDPNYAGGCVPIASDVDCAGGSGNGPAYFSGTATVVGSDIYDLDRDGDGIACQS